MAVAELEFDGKKYVPSKIAAEITGYAQDYVGQLARGGSVLARRVGGLWYVELESIEEHKRESEAQVPEPPRGTIEGNGVVEFNGEEYLSSKRASELTGYAQDYVGQLARSGEVISRQIGGRWYVSKEELIAHKKEKDGLLAAVQAQAMGIMKPTVSSQQPTASLEPLRRLRREQATFTYLKSEGDSLPRLAEKPRLGVQDTENRGENSEYRLSDIQNSDISEDNDVHPIAIRTMTIDSSRHSGNAQREQKPVVLHGYSHQGARIERRAANVQKNHGKRPYSRTAFAFSCAILFVIVVGSLYAVREYAPESVTARTVERMRASATSMYEMAMDFIVPGVSYERE